MLPIKIPLSGWANSSLLDPAGPTHRVKPRDDNYPDREGRRPGRAIDNFMIFIFRSGV